MVSNYQLSSDYHEQHAVCPVCKTSKVYCNTASIPGPKDYNVARCSKCKWKGIVDDMKPIALVAESNPEKG